MWLAYAIVIREHWLMPAERLRPDEFKPDEFNPDASAPDAEQHPAPVRFPSTLLACLAATVAVVGSARSWEAATGGSFWAWLACGLVPLVTGALIHQRFKGPVAFLGSRTEAPGAKRPGLGGLLAAVVLFLVPRLVGDGAAAVVSNSGAGGLLAAATATAVTFAVVIVGYRAAETALSRRDAAAAAQQP